MCGRYSFERVKDLKDRFDPYNSFEKTPPFQGGDESNLICHSLLKVKPGTFVRGECHNNPLPEIKASYNISPGTINPVIAVRSPKSIYLMKWGLIPFWAKDPRIGYKMINARSEEIENKPAFRKPIRSQRCLVPATGFYEWKKLTLEKKEEKIPWYIKVKNQQIFSMAGIYDLWKDAEGRETLSYSIITTTPNKFMANIHNRMPVILNQKDEDKYLDNATPLTKILALLRPFPDEKMQGWPISSRVNNPENDDKLLIAKSKRG